MTAVLGSLSAGASPAELPAFLRGQLERIRQGTARNLTLREYEAMAAEWQTGRPWPRG